MSGLFTQTKSGVTVGNIAIFGNVQGDVVDSGVPLGGRVGRVLTAFSQDNPVVGGLVATLNNSPIAGNPFFWIPIVINGVVHRIPAW